MKSVWITRYRRRHRLVINISFPLLEWMECFAAMNHPAILRIFTALALVFQLASCATPPPPPRSDQCTIRSRAPLSNMSSALCTVWVVDRTPRQINMRAEPVDAGERTLGITCSPLPGVHSYGILRARLLPGGQYELRSHYSSWTVHRTGVDYALTDKATGQVVASVRGPSLPGPVQQIGSGKSAGLKALEQAMGIQVPVTWPVWLD